MTRVGTITVDGSTVGSIEWIVGEHAIDPFIPDENGYTPEGRSSEPPHGMSPSPPQEHGASPQEHHDHHPRHHPGTVPEGEPHRPRHHHFPYHEPRSGEAGEGAGKSAHKSGVRERPAPKGSQTVNEAIEEAAKAHGLSPSFMKSVASIESNMDPSSNANKHTQYKGLFQVGTRGKDSEWARFGAGGNPYSAHDNAMAAARMFEANKSAFHKKFGRDPTNTEMYLMHQQGLGFYTRGAMTNIAGNLPAGARTPENMTHAGFERYWGNKIARRQAQFDKNPTAVPQASRQPSSHPSANYYRGEPPPASSMVPIKTSGGHTFTVHKNSADAIKGFVEDLEKAGAPIHDVGGYNRRHIAGTNRWSQHAYGNAIDINQSGRNATSRDFERWRETHGPELRAALAKHNMVSGGDWRNPDWGHFEWGGPGDTETAKK
jgi:hypothetical protein